MEMIGEAHSIPRQKHKIIPGLRSEISRP